MDHTSNEFSGGQADTIVQAGEVGQVNTGKSVHAPQFNAGRMSVQYLAGDTHGDVTMHVNNQG